MLPGKPSLLQRNTCPFASCIERCSLLHFALFPLSWNRTWKGCGRAGLRAPPLSLISLDLAFCLCSAPLAPSPPGRLSFVLPAPRTVQLSLTSCPCLGSLCVVSASVRFQFWYLTAVRLPNNLGGAWLGSYTWSRPGSLRGGVL